MSDLLFEIGTEELPPGLIYSLTEQIKNNIKSGLNTNNISINENQIKTFSTPRRIAIYITTLPGKQEIKTIEVKGPDKEKAFDKNGSPTQAAIGFAKKYNLEPKDLTIKKINNSEYVFAITKVGGQKMTDLLSKILPDSIRKTTGDKFMSWGNYDEKFARPIRWILAILDTEIIKFNYVNLESSNTTHGHRFLSDRPITINSTKEYEKKLKENNVLARREERRENIKNQIESEAKKASSIVDIDKDLLDEVTNITEYPKSLICNFEPVFLELPECIIETVLRKHQKYFVVKDLKTKKLTNSFIVITNGTEAGNEKYKSQIKKGNEKVVRARLSDAQFFYREDLKRPFTYEERIKDLGKITFQKGLGSMEEKTKRITKLSEYIYNELGKTEIKKDDLIIASKLCKLDLTTNIVFELPELQGKIGGIYAGINKFNKEIYTGISEYYNQTSNNLISSIIGIADKLDNIISLFSISKIPTGSADPFALRRQTQGIIDSILDKPDSLGIDISKLINFHIKEFLKTPSADIESKIKEFFTGRLILTMESMFAHDLVTSVCSIGDPLNNLNNTKEKIKSLNTYSETKKDNFNTFLISAKRLVRIVEAETNGNLDLKDLKTDYEKQLLRHFEELDKTNSKPYNDFLNNLITLTTPINTFFDKVLVNDPDPKIKRTRQALLKKGKTLFEKICDFNQIIERS